MMLSIGEIDVKEFVFKILEGGYTDKLDSFEAVQLAKEVVKAKAGTQDESTFFQICDSYFMNALAL